MVKLFFFYTGKVCGLLTYDCFTRIPDAATTTLEKLQSVGFEKKVKKKKKIKIKVPSLSSKKNKEKSNVKKKVKPKSPKKL